jgi:hypothetical protein
MSKVKAITAIDELLRHDTPYIEGSPVILFERSLWRKLLAAVARMAAL